jgi:hypothetical protein
MRRPRSRIQITDVALMRELPPWSAADRAEARSSGVGAVVSAHRPVADPVARAGAEAGSTVVGVGELAAVERETAAADALGEPELQALELGDALVDPRAPGGREVRPVLAGGGMVWRELRELKTDLLEPQPDALGEDDEGDAAEHGARKASMAGAGSLGGDEPSLLVETQGGGGDAAPARDLTDGQQVGCGHTVSPSPELDFKLT